MAPVSPGPDADRAFDTGLAAVTVSGLAGIGLCFWVGLFTPVEAVLAVALGMPTLVAILYFGWRTIHFARVGVAERLN